jgi:hypothetical protein
MRLITLVGLALGLLAGNASAQGIVNVTTFKDGKGKTTIIDRVGPVGPLTLDEQRDMPPHPPKGPVCPPRCVSPLACMLADQPALLRQLGLLDNAMAGYVAAVRIGLEELPRPALLNEKKVEEKKVVVQQKPEEKKIEEKKVADQYAPALMQSLEIKEWGEMSRFFVETNNRRWCLIKGCPLPELRPENKQQLTRLRGWLLKSDGEKLYFLDYFGNLYANTTGPLP